MANQDLDKNIEEYQKRKNPLSQDQINTDTANDLGLNVIPGLESQLNYAKADASQENPMSMDIERYLKLKDNLTATKNKYDSLVKPLDPSLPAPQDTVNDIMSPVVGSSPQIPYSPGMAPGQSQQSPDFAATLAKYQESQKNYMPASAQNMPDMSSPAQAETPAKLSDVISSQAAAPESKQQSQGQGSSDSSIQAELKAARESQDEQARMAAMVGAFKRMGASMAGGRLGVIKPDLTGVDAMQEQAKNQYAHALDSAKMKQANELKTAQMKLMQSQREAQNEWRNKMADTREESVVQNRIKSYDHDYMQAGKVIAASSNGGGSLGREGKRIVDGQHVQALVDAVHRGEKVTPQMVNEATAAFTRLTSGGQATVYGQEAMHNPAFQQKFADLIQKVTNDSVDAGAKSYLNVLSDATKRQVGVSDDYIKKNMTKNLAGFQHLYQDNPRYGLSKDRFIQFLANGGVDTSTAPEGSYLAKIQIPASKEAIAQQTTSPSQKLPANSNMVRIKTSSGQTGMIPKEKLQEAIARGATEI